MNLRENLRQAVANLRVNRMRTFLTMLGIIIGISAVITITTLGSSLQKTLELSFQSIGGTNQIQAFMQYNDVEDDEYTNFEWKDEDYITLEDLDAFQEAFDGRVRNVILESVMGDASVAFPENTSADPGKASVIGTTRGYLENHGLKLLRGRDLTARDQSEKKAVALVSDLFVKHVCGGTSPIGKAVDIEQSSGQVARVYVVGVYRFDRTQLRAMTQGEEGSKPVAEKDISTNILLPYRFVKENLNDEMYSEPGVSNFTITAEPGEDVVVLQDDIKNWFAENMMHTAVPALIVLGLFSFSIAGVYPLTTACIGEMTSSASVGVLLSIGGMGGIIFPWLVGVVADTSGLRGGMAVNLLPCAGIIFLPLLISRKAQRTGGNM